LVLCVRRQFSPLRVGMAWKSGVCAALPDDVPLYEVDTHNVVPVWIASDKKEVGARTIRKKITEKLPTWLTDIPPLEALPADDALVAAPAAAAGTAAAGALALRHSSSSLLQACSAPTDWAAVRAGLQVDRSVPEIEWCTPGYAAGMRAAREFAQSRLRLFADKRNDPNVAALSDLSPYYHFGQISPQRVALVIKDSKACSNGTAAFLEESIVRRELADNFCFYQPAYDSLDGAAQWARDSLELHASDPREKVYSLEELEQARSHEDIWNAAQRQMVQTGKMHGFMRMYWAKKILEWSPEPAEALRRAIYLNDKYSIDGRDPNGYVGCAWAVMGTHDMGWAERAVFGKIRCAPGRGSIARRRMRASWGLATSVRWGAALPLTVRGARATSAGAQT
jgi:deoxyribodipyrimidine photo-lyase